MKLLKFGGTSVGNAANIRLVKGIIEDYVQQNQQIAIVVSAQSGITNKLEALGQQAANSDEAYKDLLQEVETQLFGIVRDLLTVERQSKVLAALKIMLNNLEDILHGVYLLKEFSPRIRDLVLSFGERCSTLIIAHYFTQEGLSATALDTRSLIKTDSTFGNAKVKFEETNRNIKQHFHQERDIQVITGFISSNDRDQTTTLGRGGSDFTVSIIGAALDADEVEIWTDVDGVMTTDPRQVKRAFSLPTISYAEAMEMTHFGAKVIYPPTLAPLVRKRIPLRIRNTFNPAFKGTAVGRRSIDYPGPVKGIASIGEIVLVNVQGAGMVGVPGIAGRLFGALARHKVNIILITQASSEHSICFAVLPQDAQEAKIAIQEEFEVELAAEKLDPIVLEEGLSVIAAIGENMRNMPGIASKFFGALGRNGVNVAAIAQGSSELNISAVISHRDLSKALNALHGTFFQTETRNLHLFMVGTGLIGSTLLEQIKQQEDFFLNERFIRIKVVAVSNSRKMLFKPEGVDLDNWQQEIEACEEEASLEGFVKQMKELNLPNSVFIDSTASEKVPQFYKEILRNQVSIVTPNKKANSSEYSLYKALQQTALHYNVKYLYETTVGAGLPVINALQGIRLSGDQIQKVEGVLSGTLSYIFNTYDGSMPFSELVSMAKKKGYTEPDPRDDLNGMDVARKILILARESGQSLEIADVDLQQFLPDSCFEPDSVEGFFKELQKSDAAMKKLHDDAQAEGKVLRFIASLENGKAKVSLAAVGASHPFYTLSGSDNVIAYTTQRYREQPLVVKGPGAGAEVTAAGVFADLISISNFLAG